MAITDTREQKGDLRGLARDLANGRLRYENRLIGQPTDRLNGGAEQAAAPDMSIKYSIGVLTPMSGVCLDKYAHPITGATALHAPLIAKPSCRRRRPDLP
jgi:hypothetical protein